MNKLMDQADFGMVESLDGESFYLKAKDLADYKKELEENKNRAGVGLTLSKRFGMVTVVAVEKGSSGDEKKLKAGDYIRSVNDQYVQNLPLFKIYNLLEGPPNSSVK